MMGMKRFLRRFNITVLCLMAVHMLLNMIFGGLFSALFFDWERYLQLFIIGFICEQLYTAAADKEAPRVRRMRLLAAVFAAFASAHIQSADYGVMNWYAMALVILWTLWLWTQMRRRDPNKKSQNITNCVLAVVYFFHAAANTRGNYADYIAVGLEPNLLTLICGTASVTLWYYLPWFILLNMAFLAVRTYQNLSDD